MKFADLVMQGNTQPNIEVLPDEPNEYFLRANVKAFEVVEDLQADCPCDWYFWDVLRTIELDNRTRVVLHVV